MAQLGQQLIQAIKSKESDKIGRLLETIDAQTVNEANSCGDTSLHWACVRNNVDVVAKLLTIPGIDVNARGNNGMTPLTDAVASGFEAARVLMEDPRVDVNSRDNDGWTPVMKAAAECRSEALVMMVNDRRVDLDVVDKDGHRLEELVGTNHPDSTEKSKCVEIIKEEQRKRENMYREVRASVEEVRAKVTKQYFDQIDKVNKKIEERENKMGADIENNKEMMKKLKENHGLEKRTLETESSKEELKLEKKKSEIQEQINALQEYFEGIQEDLSEMKTKNRKKGDEMSKKHEHERKTLEDKFKKENEDESRHLSKLREMATLLAQDLGRLDLAPDNNTAPNLEDARNTLECPVCLDIMKPPVRIWMCSSNHLVCDKCKDRLEGRKCPTCRTEAINLRALIAEKFAITLFNN